MNELKTWENLTEAFRLYREDIYTFIYYKTNKQKDFAEDITQETFERAWVKRELFKGGSLKNWLFQIAINKVKDSYKKSNREVEVTQDLPSYDSEEMILRHFVIKALQEMSDKDKDLIIMHYILGFSYSEMAEILNEREDSIRVAVNRAFLKLKQFANGKIK